MTKSFFNPAAWREKAEELRNRQRLREPPEPSCYHQMAASGVDLTLSAEGSAVGYVTGSEEAVPMPRLPEGNPWAGGGDVGLQPPLGESVEFVEPIGTLAEQIRAAEVLRARELADAVGSAGSSSLKGGGDDPSMTASAIPALAEVVPSPAGAVPSSVAPQVPAVTLDDGTNSSEEAAHARLRQLLSEGLVRKAGPQVRRRKI
jgi:hypothetical protein